MNILLEKLAQEKDIRKQRKDQNQKVKDFSWVLFFAGEEFNHELEKNSAFQEELNTIDFSQVGNKNGEWIEKEIKKIDSNSKNKQLIDNNKYPIIWFKNLEKIKKGSALEKSLLPIFDPAQNTELFNEKIDLSNYILVATSSTRDMGKLSAPLTSRLDCINAETARPKQFFLDKYFVWLLVGSVFLIFVCGLLIFWPNKEKEKENN